MSSFPFYHLTVWKVAAAQGRRMGPFAALVCRQSSLLVKEEMGVDVTVKRERGSSTALYIQSVKIKKSIYRYLRN